ncbi:MAG: hypothetical protein R2764_04640 [Bacteroidales bacterium]
MSPGFFAWTESGEINLNAFTGGIAYVAFQYTCDNVASSTWEIDDVLIEQKVIAPEPTNYPSDFAASATGESVKTTWTDATGIQIPDGYVIFAGLNSSLPVPTDGIPIQVDSDLSDGEANVMVSYGDEEFIFNNGLVINTTYHFVIYPYTNSGTEIDYKNDGTAPTANATTTQVNTVTIEEENFDIDWGGWTRISVVGSQVWSRDNTYRNKFHTLC